MSKFLNILITYIGAYISTFLSILLLITIALFIIGDHPFSILDVLESSLKLSFGATFITYFIFSFCMKSYLASSSYSYITMYCKHFENYSFWNSGDRSQHWWDLHKLVNKFNKLSEIKYYTAPYTYHMNNKNTLIQDTAFILWHMRKEVDILNALQYIDGIGKGSGRVRILYDNNFFEKDIIVKNRWEEFLKYLDKNSPEYTQLLKRYNEKFKSKEVVNEQQIEFTDNKVKTNLDHINQDLMKEEL